MFLVGALGGYCGFGFGTFGVWMCSFFGFGARVGFGFGAFVALGRCVFSPLCVVAGFGLGEGDGDGLCSGVTDGTAVTTDAAPDDGGVGVGNGVGVGVAAPEIPSANGPNAGSTSAEFR
jgi:hypothetical protein